ncbi:MAG: hypothetical protein K6E51_04480, partial [Treponema sp.]|nr:hypothetical protein [Treponema sp.]
FVPPCKDISGKNNITIERGYSIIKIETCGITRTLEISEELTPQILDIADNHTRFKYIIQKIADVKVLNRGDHGFAIFNILARKALHINDDADHERLLSDIALINRRADCSDFVLSGLFRYLLFYGIDGHMQDIVKETLLHYRYWMNMDGQDGMCFWSENHSLMFYTCGYLAGRMYPSKYFSRAHMTGAELHALSSKKIDQWLDDVLENGFEEFLSAVYMCVTFAALLNVHDFTDESKKQKAKRILDTMIESLAVQVFDHSVIAPMGRVYRGCLYPFQGGSNSILLLATNKICYDYSEGWTSFFANTTYTFPQNLLELEQKTGSIVFSSGNALITTEKTKDYILTSVASPRNDQYERWHNVILDHSGNPDSHSYTKSMNECFHGTSYFQSGVLGYQQHLWYAALSCDAVLFMNHPGTTAEQSDMRPGYWHGNGVFPALKQVQNKLYGIYAIPATHPIHFVHAYLPRERFDTVISNGKWTFLKKNNGYLALWCSETGTPYNDMLFNCEIRYYSDTTAFFLIAGNAQTDGSFDGFIQKTQNIHLSFTFPVLLINEKEVLRYIHHADASQIID